MVLEKLTKTGKIGLGMFVVGTVFFLVGFSVPYWVVLSSVTTERIGLWDYCIRDYCRSTVDRDFTRFDRDGPPSWYRGTQALACLALIALIADLVVRFLFLCGKPKRFLLASIVADCAACILAIMAAVVFGNEVDRYVDSHLHFGFAFDIIGGVVLGFSAIIFLVEYCRHH